MRAAIVLRFVPPVLPYVLATLLAAGCSPADSPTGAPGETAPSPAESTAIEDLRTALASWQRYAASPEKSPAILASVQHAAERATDIEHPSADLDRLLGHALANVLLRPDLGVPRLERAVGDAPDAATVDAWLDALLRLGDLPKLASEHQRLRGAPLDVDHPAARAATTQAALSADLHWTDLRDAVAAARLVEDALAAPRFTLDRPIDSIGAAFEAAGMLFQGWDLRVAAARTTLPADPVPESTPGVIPAGEDHRRVLGYAHSPDAAALRNAGTQLDLDRSARNNTLVVAATPPTGGRVFLTVEGGWREGALWLHSANDTARVVGWLGATDRLLELRRAGRPDAEIAKVVRAEFQSAVLTGR